MISSSVNAFLLVIISVVCAVELAPPKFNAIQKNVTVVVGNTAVLPCTVKSLGSFKIVWVNPDEKTLTFEDRRITEDERVSLERPYVNEWNLHVREVVMKDAGVYLCQINTQPVQVRPVQLIVQQPSTIIGSLSSLEVVKVTEGETVQLVCNVTGYPTPEVTWYRVPKGLRENEDNDKKIIGAKGEVLMIHNVSRYCDDDYECVAFNGVQPADTRKMRVRVQFQPEVRLPNKKIGQVLGLYTILECEVTAFPQSISSWRHKGAEINGNDKKYTTELYNDGGNKITLTLKIQSLTYYDYGDYECFSENFLGRDSEIMTLYEYVKKTTTPSTTTTTTTTPAPWNGGGYDGNDDDDDDNDDDDNLIDGYGGGGGGGRDHDRNVNPYNPYNNNGHYESKLHLRKNEHNDRNTGRENNRGRDGSVQSVISEEPNNSGSSCRPADVINVILLAAIITSALSLLAVR